MYTTMIICSFLPTWSLAAYLSNDIVFDGILYDFIIVFSAFIFFYLLGQTSGFKIVNYIGVLFCFIGFVLMKLK